MRAAVLAAIIALELLIAHRAGAAGDVQRGQQLFALAAGCGCHTSKDGPPGAGGGEVPTPFGTFYAPNITPDQETGIGAWSDVEIAAAIRDGTARGKGTESPAMPYYWYRGMSDQDLADLIAYLRHLAPVKRPNRSHRDELPLARWAYWGWRGVLAPRLAPSQPLASSRLERGRYLVNHVAICPDCHTPRSRFGAPQLALYLAGSANGPAGKPVPNITPHDTGIADWDAADIVNLLKTGFMPNYDTVQGYMADVIEGHGGGPGYKDAADSDIEAIAAYIKSIAPIDNQVDQP